MVIRRIRRSTLALWLILALCVGGYAVCYSAEGESLPTETTAPETSSEAQLPSPFYEDENATTAPETEARAERSPLSRVKIFSKPARQNAPAPASAVDPLDITDKVVVPAKTPLPKVPETAAGDTDDSSVPPVARSRSSNNPTILWTVGLLAAGIIIRQIIKVGSPLSNTAPTVVEVLSRQSLGPQQQLSIVRFGQRLLLVGTTSSGMSTLAEVSDPGEVHAILTELQTAHSGSGGALGLFRQKKSSSDSRPGRSRKSDSDRTSPAVSVSLSTESRTAAHERRSPSPHNHEVNDG